MLLTKMVKVKWFGSNKKHYIEKGYIYTKIGDEFEVKVEDLSEGSGEKIEVKCDCCNKILSPMQWTNYIKNVREDGKYYCRVCNLKLYGGENGRKTKLKNSKSFEQWCYDNLSKDEADEILSRWDYEKNVDKDENVIKPNEIGYSSNGFNRKGYWFKCDKHPEHESELKNISSFTGGQNGSMKCNKCNSFAQWGISNLGEDFLKKYWDFDKNNKGGINPWEISYSCHTKVWIKCQEKDYHIYEVSCGNFVNGKRCGYCHGTFKTHPKDSFAQWGIDNICEDFLDKYWDYELNKNINPWGILPNAGKYIFIKCQENIYHNSYKVYTPNFTSKNTRCPNCQRSKGEQHIEEYLINNNIKYIPQYEYDGLIGVGGGNLSYDFYLSQFDILIEYQGEFHDGNVGKKAQTKKQKEKQKEHDRRKKEYAEDNKIKLLPIWYWDFDNIEEILDKELNKIIT